MESQTKGMLKFRTKDKKRQKERNYNKWMYLNYNRKHT